MSKLTAVTCHEECLRPYGRPSVLRSCRAGSLFFVYSPVAWCWTAVGKQYVLALDCHVLLLHDWLCGGQFLFAWICRKKLDGKREFCVNRTEHQWRTTILQAVSYATSPSFSSLQRMQKMRCHDGPSLLFPGKLHWNQKFPPVFHLPLFISCPCTPGNSLYVYCNQ